MAADGLTVARMLWFGVVLGSLCLAPAAAGRDEVPPAVRPLRVHLVRGLRTAPYRLETALALTGGVDSACADNGVGGVAGFDVTVIPIRLSSTGDGIALIDRTHGTICLYQYQPRNDAHERFVLLAVRSFRYDIQLENYNTADPNPAAIREMLERRGATGDVDRAVEAAVAEISVDE